MLTQSLVFDKGLVSEFRFNEPVVNRNLSTSPVVIASTVLAPGASTERVWLNASVDWTFSFTGTGPANVLFEITRNGAVIHSAVQSISGSSIIFGFVVYNHLALQHLDVRPASGTGPVLYKLQARVMSAPPGTATVTSAVLSAAKLILTPSRRM